MTIIYVPRVFGGTLILTVTTQTSIVPNAQVVVTFRDGEARVTYRDGQVQVGDRG